MRGAPKVLSNGQQFSLNLARTLAEKPALRVVDEFAPSRSAERVLRTLEAPDLADVQDYLETGKSLPAAGLCRGSLWCGRWCAARPPPSPVWRRC